MTRHRLKLLRSSSLSGVRIPLVRKDCSSVGRAAATKKPSVAFIPSLLGPVAQLGERCVRNAEVGSSILPRSTFIRV